MHIKYFFVTAIIFVVTVFGQPRVDTSNIGLVLKISLQRETFSLGEPILLKSTLINKSPKPIEIPTFSADAMKECGMTGLILVEPSGKRNPYHIGFHAGIFQPFEGMNTKKLLSSDSIYWWKLYWLENFGAPESLEGFVPGRYQMIGTYWYSVGFKDGRPIDNKLSDSISFILSYNPKLLKAIKPIREYLKNLFLWDGQSLDAIRKKGRHIVSNEARAECFYQYLMKIRRMESPFTLYADYLLPTIASLIKYRKKRAILFADEFREKYPYSPLSEEMAFWKGRFLEREWYKKPEYDSVMEVRLKPVFKQYPKNGYRFAFGDFWKKFD